MPGFDKAIDSQCSGVVVDLSGVEYINSIGVSSFMDTFNYLRGKGLNVVLCSPIPPVFKVLKLARTELIVPVTETRSEAKQLIYAFPGQKTSHPRENILLIMGKVNIKEGLAKVLKETEQEANYNIVTALNPARAWKILGGKGIQLLILDVTTDAGQGQHLLKQVRTNRELKGLPFVVASDEKHLSDAAYYTKNGADDILRYPFNPYETPVRIRTALSLFYSWQKDVEFLKATNNQPGYRQSIR